MWRQGKNEGHKDSLGKAWHMMGLREKEEFNDNTFVWSPTLINHKRTKKSTLQILPCLVSIVLSKSNIWGNKDSERVNLLGHNLKPKSLSLDSNTNLSDSKD